MTRQEVADFVNELIVEEHGDEITEETKLVDSGVDSFGLTMILVSVDAEYDVYPKDVFKEIDFANITLGKIIDDVLAKHEGN